MAESQAVDSVTGVITPSVVIFATSFFTASLNATGALRGGCTTGLASGFSLIVYSPSRHLKPWNTSLY